MKQKSTDKFRGRDDHFFGCVVIGSVSVFKTDLIVIYRFYPIIRYGNTMRIAAKIFKDLLRAGKWSLGVDEPFDTKKKSDKTAERRFVFVIRKFAWQ